MQHEKPFNCTDLNLSLNLTLLYGATVSRCGKL